MKDENGHERFETVQLDKPQVSFFRVFNAEQVQDFPSFTQDKCPKPEIDTIIDRIIDTSECPIQPKSFGT